MRAFPQRSPKGFDDQKGFRDHPSAFGEPKPQGFPVGNQKTKLTADALFPAALPGVPALGRQWLWHSSR
ncbi:MAG: hypothetical protein CM15mP39_05320 [Synechococcus sp.]|nr:MAG: hypothetical protein CM15mP39_05320 [Synechococcus sp.]